MPLSDLIPFMAVMWIMILAVAAFLVLVVAPLEHYFGELGRLAVSAMQAAIAITAVIALVFGLSRIKRIYMQRKLDS